MSANRTATAAEKSTFTSLAKFFDGLTHINGVRNQEIKGDKNWVKFQFNLKANNPHIHVLEFGVKKGEVANIRLVVSNPTKKSDFYAQATKLGKAIYGGIVIHIDAEEKEIPSILAKLDKLAEASEEITLDPKRTYCDPPAGWVKDRTGKEGITKKEVKAPVEEVEAPTAEAEDQVEKAA